MAENKVGLGRLYKVQEVASYLGISRQWLYHYIDKGILSPSIRGKKYVRFTKNDILEGLSQMRSKEKALMNFNAREGE